MKNNNLDTILLTFDVWTNNGDSSADIILGNYDCLSTAESVALKVTALTGKQTRVEYSNENWEFDDFGNMVAIS